MRDSDTLASINDALYLILSKYLSTKLNSSALLSFITSKPDFVTKIVAELDSAITVYNKKRKSGIEEYFFNSLELSNVLKEDLPLFSKIRFDSVLTQSIGTQLRDDSYFSEVWQITDSTYLLCNLLLLIYRTSILTIHKKILVSPEGKRRVQISSTLEEMIIHLRIKGQNTTCYLAFMMWLENWKEEGFSEKLFYLSQQT